MRFTSLLVVGVLVVAVLILVGQYLREPARPLLARNGDNIAVNIYRAYQKDPCIAATGARYATYRRTVRGLIEFDARQRGVQDPVAIVQLMHDQYDGRFPDFPTAYSPRLRAYFLAAKRREAGGDTQIAEDRRFWAYYCLGLPASDVGRYDGVIGQSLKPR